MIAVAARTRTYPVLMPDRGARDAGALPRRRRSSPMMRVLAAAVLLALPAIVYVGQSTKAARAGYGILTLRQDVGALQAEHARLLAAVTALKSPERIERVAVRDLGMIKPHPQQMAALILPPITLAAQPAAQPTVWQRLGALLLRREAQAGESH